MAKTQSQIQKLIGSRNDLIEQIIKIVESRVANAQSWLTRQIVEDLLDKLEIEDGKIKNTQANKRILSMIDSVFARFGQSKQGELLAKSVIDGVEKIVNFNSRYFVGFTEPAKLGKVMDQVKKDLGSWLGIDAKGNLQENGYLKTLITDVSVRNQVKNIAINSIVGQAGYNDTRKSVHDFIAGNSDKAGALQGYYRNFVYDMFSQIDRTNSKLFADKLQLRFAIYEGGIIKTSRKFCRDKNGNVYHREEIAEWEITEARPPGYNPFTDMGGYGCRHHYNWIPDALAYALRPELRILYPANAA